MHSLQCPVSITADGINTKDQARRTVLITYVPHWRNAGTLSSSMHFTRHNHVVRPTSNCLSRCANKGGLPNITQHPARAQNILSCTSIVN